MSIELVVTASSPTVTTDPSTSQYGAELDRALKDFEKLMEQDDYKPTSFESPEAVSEELLKTVQRFDDFRGGNKRLKTWLEYYVDIIFTISATLWEPTQAVSLTRDSLPRVTVL